METSFLNLSAMLGQSNQEPSGQAGPFRTELDPQKGKGHLLQIVPSMGVVTYLFNVNFDQETILKIPTREKESVRLFYALKGNSCYLNPKLGRSDFFDHFQTNVHWSPDFLEGSIHIAGGQQMQLLFTELCKPKFMRKYPSYKDLMSKLDLSVRNRSVDNTRLHRSSHNLSIYEQVKGLLSPDGDLHPSSTLNAEIICKRILTMQLEQLYLESNGQPKCSDLMVREMQRIIELAEWINQNLEQTHSVTALSRRTGLSPNKLQLGFKTIYGNTVSDYIRNLRLAKAEELIRTTDMNISEVVYTIGFTSRSYFCKIFKRKFNCAPKQYKNMVWRRPIKKAVPADPLSN